MTLQIPSYYRLLISLAFFLSTVVCLPASAGDPPVKQGPSTTVKFADLDLNTDAGRRELLDRLRKAARRVCAEDAYLHGDVAYPPRCMARATTAHSRLLWTSFTISSCLHSLRPLRARICGEARVGSVRPARHRAGRQTVYDWFWPLIGVALETDAVRVARNSRASTPIWS